MSREIRLVPSDWQHPVDESGRFIPVYDLDYDTAPLQWVNEVVQWEQGDHHERNEATAEGIRYYWDWELPPPTEESYRPVHESEPQCFQVYETVTEGTPISPIFHDETSLLQWLIEQGDSPEVAREFIRRRGCAEPFIWNEDGPSTIQVLYDKDGC